MTAIQSTARGARAGVSAIAFGLALLLSPTLSAQEIEADATEDTTTVEAEASAETSAPIEEVKRATLDEVIVVAQKRAEDVQDVPLSVSAISGEDIKEKNMADLRSVSSYTPNMEVVNTPTFNFIRMRGLGSGWNRGFEQSVAVVIDEVFYGRPSYLSNGQLDLQTVEVLRGPQGTLFGKNAVAGALHLRTARPENEWLLDADATYGTDKYLRFRGSFGGPLFSDELSFRIAIMDEERDPNAFNVTLGNLGENNINNQNARLKLLWEPSASFRVLISMNGGTILQEGTAGQPAIVTPRNQAVMEQFDPTFSAKADDFTHKDLPEYVDRDFWDVTTTVEADVSDHTITNILNVAWFDEDVFFDPDYAPMPALKLDNNEDYRQLSEEIRITSPDGDFRYVFGAYAFFSDIYATYDYSTFITIDEALAATGAGELAVCDGLFRGNPEEEPNANAELHRQCREATLNNAAAGALAGQLIIARQGIEGVTPIESSNRTFDQQTQSYAMFGQIDWDITEKFAIAIGARMSYEVKELEITHALVNHRTGGNGNVILEDPETGNYSYGGNPAGIITLQFFTPGIEEFEAERRRTEFNIAPKFSVTYRPVEDVMSYITVAQGFKSGGFNAQPNRANNIEFDEEESITYEAGVKSEFLGGAARFNISGFYTSFEGLQIAAFNGVEFVVDNAADATIYGVEWEGMVAPMYGLLFNLSGSWTIAEYDEFDGGPCPVDHPDFLPCDLAGGTLPTAPEWNLNVGATYDRPFFNMPFNLHFGIDGLFVSSFFHNTDLDPRSEVDATWKLRARFGIHDADNQWAIMLFADNITDERNWVIFNDTPAQFDSFFGILEEGRTFQIQARYQF